MKFFQSLRAFLFPHYDDDDPREAEVRSLLYLLSILSYMSFQMWRSMFNNFAVEVGGIDAAQMGIIQSVREIPGFLSLLVIFLLILIREQKLALLSLALMGLGVMMTGLFPDFAGILIATFIMSVGFHYFETLNQSLTLQHIAVARTPRFLGQIRSYSSLAGILGILTVLILSPVLGYRTLFLLAGGLVLIGSSYAALRYPIFKPKVLQRKKMFLKREYWLYYTLTFLSGARRQIFVAFAVFLMVRHFEFSVRTVTLLFFVNSSINMFWAPLISRMIDAWGERIVISIEYAGLIFVFLGYAYTRSPWVIIALYILDHLFFNMSMAIRTYFQKIAAPEDIAPTTAVGFTINHIAAVVVPFAGGLIWMFDYSYTFLFGVLLAALSLLFAQFVRVPENPQS